MLSVLCLPSWPLAPAMFALQVHWWVGLLPSIWAVACRQTSCCHVPCPTLQVDKVKAATALVKEARPDLFVEGEHTATENVVCVCDHSRYNAALP